MLDHPEKLAEMLELFELMERSERIDALMGLAERFKGVPEWLAERPYPESHRVKECESQAYVWADERPDKTLTFHFAVENPQGVAAVATAVILNETLSGAPLDEVAQIRPDLIFKFFEGELSLRKRMGLAGMVNRVRHYAKQYLARFSQIDNAT